MDGKEEKGLQLVIAFPDCALIPNTTTTTMTHYFR